jgi:hypothetical protein
MVKVASVSVVSGLRLWLWTAAAILVVVGVVMRTGSSEKEAGSSVNAAPGVAAHEEARPSRMRPFVWRAVAHRQHGSDRLQLESHPSPLDARFFGTSDAAGPATEEDDCEFLMMMRVVWKQHRSDGVVEPMRVLELSGSRYSSVVFVDDEPAFGDRNSDGVADVLVELESGGTCWTCRRLGLLQIVDAKLVDLLDAPDLNEARWPRRFEDVDDDGIPELIVSDLTFEFALPSGSHSDGPIIESVYAFRAGVMKEATGSPHLAAQARRYEDDYRSAVAAQEAWQSLLAAGSLLVIDLARAPASAAPAMDRYYLRIKTAAIPTAMKADVRALERLATETFGARRKLRTTIPMAL